MGSQVTEKQYLVKHLTIVIIKDIAGKYRKLNRCQKNFGSFNRENSTFLSNQRPDGKDKIKHKKSF